MNAAELKARLLEVQSILAEAGTPDSLAPAAFAAVWGAFDNRPVGTGSVQPVNSSGPLAALADRTGLEGAHLADIFAVTEDGSVAVGVSAKKLSPAKARATVEIALLTCAARQAAGETATPVRVIRQKCAEYARLDGPNFSSTLRGADDNWQISGKGADIALALRRPGWDEAVSLMRRLMGAA